MTQHSFDGEEKIDCKSLTFDALKEQIGKLGQPSFRAGQIYSWLHQKQVDNFSQMLNLPAALRAKLDETYYINRLTIKQKLVSEIDGTIKYLYELGDANCVEAVLMRYKHGNSLCISTQVGCRMGCSFCASAVDGLVRNLTPSEMLDEVYMAAKDSGEKVSSLVLMGIGEPLDNFDNVMRFLELLSSEQGINLSLRHVSLSTCGLVDRIYDLMERKLQLTLSISLHAPNDEIRSRTMPVNKKWNVDALLDACKKYSNRTGRRISFEYALIHGVNDSAQNAEELAFKLKGMGAHVNLIPVNAIDGKDYKKSTPLRIQKFKELLEKRGVNVTVRRELGSDINAACGQLRRQSQKGGDLV